MDDDALKLTTYFGERDRTEHGLLGDELLKIYGEHRLRASVLLRGAAGFGRTHRLRSDRLLTLSEDLPAISIAVDRRERIEAMLEPILQIKHHGVITLERTRLLEGAPDRARSTGQVRGAARLTIFLGRRERVGGAPAFAAVTDLLHRRQIAGATVLLGVDGTKAGRRVRAKFLARNTEVPAMVLAIGDARQMQEIAAELEGVLREPMITLERVQVCKRDGQLLAPPHELPATDVHGLARWQKLMIYTSQAAVHDGHPLNLQIMRELRESGAAGATSVRGIWGFHGDHSPHGDRFLQLRRHVPVVTIVIDAPARITRSFEIIDRLTAKQGLVTSEMVPAMAAMSEPEKRARLQLASDDF